MLTNDYDYYHLETLTVTAVQNAGNVAGTVGQVLHGTHGDLTLNSDGSYSYMLTDSAGGPDVFTYTVTDTSSGSPVTATATLTIALDQSPSVTTHAVSVAEGATRSNATGDTDPDGDTLTVTAVAGSAGNVGTSVAGTYGHLTLSSTGSYSYVADQTAAIDGAAHGAHPVDSFSYTVDDGHGGTATETITFTIDRPPTLSFTDLASTFTEPAANPATNETPVSLISGASASDPDDLAAQATGATIAITNGTFFAGDHLTIGGSASGTLDGGAI